MFKKLFPLIVVLALLAAYADYRAVDAQAGASGSAKIAAASSQSGEVIVPDTGSASQIKTWSNLSTGDAAYSSRHLEASDCNTPDVRSVKEMAGPQAAC